MLYRLKLIIAASILLPSCVVHAQPVEDPYVAVWERIEEPLRRGDLDAAERAATELLNSFEFAPGDELSTGRAFVLMERIGIERAGHGDYEQALEWHAAAADMLERAPTLRDSAVGRSFYQHVANAHLGLKQPGKAADVLLGVDTTPMPPMERYLHEQALTRALVPAGRLEEAWAAYGRIRDAGTAAGVDPFRLIQSEQARIAEASGIDRDSPDFVDLLTALYYDPAFEFEPGIVDIGRTAITFAMFRNDADLVERLAPDLLRRAVEIEARLAERGESWSKPPPNNPRPLAESVHQVAEESVWLLDSAGRTDSAQLMLAAVFDLFPGVVDHEEEWVLSLAMKWGGNWRELVSDEALIEIYGGEDAARRAWGRLKRDQSPAPDAATVTPDNAPITTAPITPAATTSPPARPGFRAWPAVALGGIVLPLALILRRWLRPKPAA